jgi:ferric-dicitrate binding protein FerR (iron transport regulator)
METDTTEMQNKEKEIRDLAILYWEGTISPRGETVLFEFISDETNRKKFARWEKEWQHSHITADTVNKEWKRFRNRVHTREAISAETAVGHPAVWWKKTAAAAAIALILMATGIGSIKTAALFNREIFTVEAPSGEKSKVTLPDGSIVWLNAASRITYSNRFNTGDRTVRLDGEAYFEVTRQKNRTPFTVKIRDYDVTVKGTKFNISSYPGDQYVKTTLMEGLVTLSYRDEQYPMQPGEQMQLDVRTRQLRLHRVNTKQYKSWMDDNLVYDEITLEELLNRLSRQYNVKIHVQPDILPDSRFSISLNNRETVEEILQGIAKIIPFKYKYQNNNIYVLN